MSKAAISIEITRDGRVACGLEQSENAEIGPPAHLFSDRYPSAIYLPYPEVKARNGGALAVCVGRCASAIFVRFAALVVPTNSALKAAAFAVANLGKRLDG